MKVSSKDWARIIDITKKNPDQEMLRLLFYPTSEDFFGGALTGKDLQLDREWVTTWPLPELEEPILIGCEDITTRRPSFFENVSEDEYHECFRNL